MARPTTSEPTKNSRISLILTEKLKEQLEKCAMMDETSVNAKVIDILSAYIDTRLDDIDQFTAAIQAIKDKKKNSSDAQI